MSSDAPRRRPPLLVVVCGLMASGKSTTSRVLAERLGAERYVADDIRADARAAGRPADVPGFSREVYDTMLERAGELLAAGRSVVLDGTFRRRGLRRRARDTAACHGARFLLVECACDPDVCRTRLGGRDDPEGWRRMFDHFLPLWEPLEEPLAAEFWRVDTGRPAEEVELDLARRVASLTE
jgi:hypothetical protein